MSDNDISHSTDVPRSSVDDVIDSVIRNTKDSNNTATTLSSTSTHAELNVTQQHQPIATAAANKDSSHMEAAHTLAMIANISNNNENEAKTKPLLSPPAAVGESNESQEPNLDRVSQGHCYHFNIL